MLPDDVLLEIFDFCLDEDASEKKDIEAWQSLVHVCRRWRSVVFGSPRRLNLRLVCEPRTPRDTLDVWPPLLLVFRCGLRVADSDVDGITAMLELRDRLCQIKIYDVDLPLQIVWRALQEPFPELTEMVFHWCFLLATPLPDSFLGGSAPRLRKFRLGGIPFPGLPKLLLFTTHLVDLQLYYISDSGNFSPEAFFTALSTLTSLRFLILKFRKSLSPRSRPSQASRRPPPTRSLLSVLNTLRFEGVSEYLDDLVARIDAPRLNNFKITFFNQSVLDTPQLTQFISRTPTLEALEKAYVAFQFHSAAVKFSSRTSGYGEFTVEILCKDLNWQVSSLKRFCTSNLPVSTSEDLYIYGEDLYPEWEDESDDGEDIQWLELLRPFAAVENLYLSEDAARHIGPALQELVGGSTSGTEVLPIVQNIFLGGFQPWGPVPESIEEFIDARQLSDQFITVSSIPLSERDSVQDWLNELDD
jgi:hypothetical protein